ncbi:Na+/H+ antiporter subunit E [Actinomycetota bacterium]
MTRRRRLIASDWPTLIVLCVVWCLVWGSLAPLTVLGGLAVAALVLLVFPLPRVALPGQVSPPGVARLTGRFLRDLVTASAHVAAAALRPGPVPPSAIIAVPLRTRSDLTLTMTAELICLVPGSVVIEIDRPTATLYLHVLHAETDEQVVVARHLALEQERRVIEAFGSESDRAACHAPSREGALR